MGMAPVRQGRRDPQPHGARLDVRAEVDAIEAKIARLAAYCGLSPNFDAFLSAINGLRAKLNVPNTLKDFKVSGEKRELIGEMAIVDPTAGGNPVELTKKLALEIFDRAMEGRL